MLHARVAAIASGTSTLEAALIGTPFAMVYQVAPLTWTFGRRLVKVDRFAMPNLIAERDVVPELVQDDFTPQRVCAELQAILPDGDARDAMMRGFDAVREKLHVIRNGWHDQRARGAGRAGGAEAGLVNKTAASFHLVFPSFIVTCRQEFSPECIAQREP